MRGASASVERPAAHAAEGRTSAARTLPTWTFASSLAARVRDPRAARLHPRAGPLAGPQRRRPGCASGRAPTDLRARPCVPGRDERPRTQRRACYRLRQGVPPRDTDDARPCTQGRGARDAQRELGPRLGAAGRGGHAAMCERIHLVECVQNAPSHIAPGPRDRPGPLLSREAVLRSEHAERENGMRAHRNAAFPHRSHRARREVLVGRGLQEAFDVLAADQ
jgi:hypothetical protein